MYVVMRRCLIQSASDEIGVISEGWFSFSILFRKIKSAVKVKQFINWPVP